MVVKPGALLAVLALVAAGCAGGAAQDPALAPCQEGVRDCFPMREVAQARGIDVDVGPGKHAFLPVDEQGEPRMDTGVGMNVMAAGMDTMVGGVALGDIDRDGDLDLYIADEGADHLFLNDGNARFRDVTDRVEASGDSDGSAAVFFDADGDGWLDLLVGGLKEHPRLLRNDKGHFQDVSVAAGLAGVEGPVMGVAAADMDGDRDLDLYLATYMTWWQGDVPLMGIPVAGSAGAASVPGKLDVLLRNNGNGTFTDVTAAAGITGIRPTLAVSWSDYDRDGDMDAFVANDFHTGGQLWRNRGNGTFEDASIETGLVSRQNGMGSIWADLVPNGWLDMYVSNIFLESRAVVTDDGNDLLANLGDGRFHDQSTASGTVNGLWAWGGAAFDAESDGDVDLYVPNGFPSAQPAPRSPTDRSPPKLDFIIDQPNRFFVNAGGGTFTNEAAAWGVEMRVDGRAAAFGDLNGDGAIDLVTTAVESPVMVFLNAHEQGNMVRIDLEAPAPNVHAIGAQVVATVGARTLATQVAAGSGFLSQSSPQIHVGLGQATQVDRLDVHWPGGPVETFEDVAAGHYRLRQGGNLRPA